MTDIICCDKKMKRCSSIYLCSTKYKGKYIQVEKADYWCFLCRTRKELLEIPEEDLQYSK